MDVILVSDNTTFLNDLISKTNITSGEVIKSDFNFADIISNKLNIDTLGLFIVYCENQFELPPDQLLKTAFIFGILQAKKVPLYTNLKLLSSGIHSEDQDFHLYKNAEEIIEKIVNDYNHIIKNADQRYAKNRLLSDGIPVSSDSFLFYLESNNTKLIEYFIRAGINVNGTNASGTPYLNMAVRKNNLEFVKLLTNAGADINLKSQDRGYTALMDAVWRGNYEISEYLISAKADVNTLSKDGETNLIIAVGAGKENICKLLVENGADPDIKDDMDMSAYDYAVLFKKEKLIEILKPYHKE